MTGKSFFVFLLLLLLGWGGIFLFKEDLDGLLFRFADFEKTIEENSRQFVVQTAEPKISLPPPLRAEKEAPSAVLSRSGVITFTNIKRALSGLPPLAENLLLNRSAEIKLRDMFANQYFAHVSPSGDSVDTLAKAVRYEYIALGENLALGNYENDNILVQAWMDSPGHRENILSENFTEIGVAVGQGIFEGQQTWLAVQEFGRPLSDCPQPDKSLEIQIEEDQQEIDVLSQELQERREELQGMRPKHGAAYNQKAEEYNALVEQYNNLIELNKQNINSYNTQVNEFNVCIAG